MSIPERIDQLNWGAIAESLNDRGYACATNIWDDNECDQLILQYNNDVLYRKTINMERYRFGLGEYKYFQYPLPAIIQQLRENVYPKLAPVANNWMRILNIGTQFPGTLTELLDLCQLHKQNRPTP